MQTNGLGAGGVSAGAIAANGTIASVTYDPHVTSTAVGDGSTDDAAAINATIVACAAAGGGTVRLRPGKTYLCGDRGSTYLVGAITIQPRVRMKTGVTLDLNGATIKAKASTGGRFYLVAPDSAAETDWAVVSSRGWGRLDGNDAAHSTPTSGHAYALLGVFGSARVHLDKLRFIDGLNYAVWMLTADDIDIGSLMIENSKGDGFAFGLYGTAGEQRVASLSARSLVAKNIGENLTKYSAQVGNPLICNMQGFRIDYFRAVSASAGIKIQLQTRDGSFGDVYLDAGTLGVASSNSGFKFQGSASAPASTIDRVKVDNLVVKNCADWGLYFTYANDCSVKNYYGEKNGGTTDEDIRFGINAIRCHLGKAYSYLPNFGRAGTPVAVLFYDTTNLDCVVDDLTVYDCPYRAVQIQGGRGRIRRLRVVDDAGTATLNRGLNVVLAGAAFDIDLFESNLHFASTLAGTSPSLIASVTAWTGKVREVKCDGELTWAVAPLAAASTTAVATNAVARVSNGTDFLQPSFGFQQRHAASKLWRPLISASIPTTGFTIGVSNGTPTLNDPLEWRALEWRTGAAYV